MPILSEKNPIGLTINITPHLQYKSVILKLISSLHPIWQHLPNLCAKDLNPFVSFVIKFDMHLTNGLLILHVVQRKIERNREESDQD